MGNRRKGFIALLVAVAVSACGTYTPDKDPFVGNPLYADKSSWQGTYEQAIVDHITCEIGDGLTMVKTTGVPFPWLLNDWGTTVTQTITVEDQTGLSPGISPTKIFTNGFFPNPAANGGNVTIAQSFGFNLGGTASANAVRTETIQYTFRNKDILDAYGEGNCHHTLNGVMIDGDLKIREFINDKAQIAHSGSIQLMTGNSSDAPYNTFTEEITFVGSYGASVTPTWHLARFSADTSANLLIGQRTNTNDLVITLGAVKCPQPPQPTITWEKVVRELDRHNVQTAVVKGPEIVGVYTKDGKAFRTKAPDATAAVDKLKEKGVLVTFQQAAFQSPNDQKAQECPKGGPVLLADNAMSQHQARVQAAAIAVSVTSQTH
jgi:hypothetical protein